MSYLFFSLSTVDTRKIPGFWPTAKRKEAGSRNAAKALNRYLLDRWFNVAIGGIADQLRWAAAVGSNDVIVAAAAASFVAAQIA